MRSRLIALTLLLILLSGSLISIAVSFMRPSTPQGGASTSKPTSTPTQPAQHTPAYTPLPHQTVEPSNTPEQEQHAPKLSLVVDNMAVDGLLVSLNVSLVNEGVDEIELKVDSDHVLEVIVRGGLLRLRYEGGKPPEGSVLLKPGDRLMFSMGFELPLTIGFGRYSILVSTVPLLTEYGRVTVKAKPLQVGMEVHVPEDDEVLAYVYGYELRATPSSEPTMYYEVSRALQQLWGKAIKIRSFNASLAELIARLTQPLIVVRVNETVYALKVSGYSTTIYMCKSCAPVIVKMSVPGWGSDLVAGIVESLSPLLEAKGLKVLRGVVEGVEASTVRLRTSEGLVEFKLPRTSIVVPDYELLVVYKPVKGELRVVLWVAVSKP